MSCARSRSAAGLGKSLAVAGEGSTKSAETAAAPGTSAEQPASADNPAPIIGEASAPAAAPTPATTPSNPRASGEKQPEGAQGLLKGAAGPSQRREQLISPEGEMETELLDDPLLTTDTAHWLAKTFDDLWDFTHVSLNSAPDL
jgi:hypothetical protein